MSKENIVVDQLDEKKATGENSVAADPVGGETPKRKADLKKKFDPNADTGKDDGPNKGPNKVGMKEAFSKLFDGEGLSEDFKEKIVAVFEAAVVDKTEAFVAEEAERLEGEYAAKLEEHKAELDEKVGHYMDYAIQEWDEENEVALESNIKVEVAESLMSGLKTLVNEHNMEVDEDSKAVMEGMETRLSESEEKYNKLFEKMTNISEEKESLEKFIALAEASDGLTDTQSEKLETLAEGLSFTDIKGYKNKLFAIKENYFS